MTRSQKQAWYILAFLAWMLLYSGLLFINIEWLTAAVGVTGQGVVVFLVVRYLLARRKRKQSEIKVDERDRLILSKVLGYQNVIMLVVIFVWMSVFNFRYDSAYDEIPAKFVNLMFISVILANIAAYPVFTLVAYYRANRHGRGLDSGN